MQSQEDNANNWNDTSSEPDNQLSHSNDFYFFRNLWFEQMKNRDPKQKTIQKTKKRNNFV